MKRLLSVSSPLFWCGLLLAGAAWAVNPGPFPAGVPGSGYGCERSCDTGDRNYVIYARIKTYTIVNSGQVTNPQKLSPNDQDIGYRTRTFVGDSELSSPFCLDGYDGSDGVLGPCLTVNPGETVMIKIVNEMDDGMEELEQVPADKSQFFSFIDSIPAGILPGPRAETAEDLTILNVQDMPGMSVTFDDTNLHLHGLHVVPHMFYPQGTNDPNADWITITPKSENPDQKCFCYVFEVPEEHPQGTFFWHNHRHGSNSMQGWQGMMGYLFVGTPDNDGSPFKQLSNQGVTHWEPLMFWEMQANVSNVFSTTVNSQTLEEGEYIEIFTHENSPTEQQFFYPVNNQFFPTFTMETNEIVYFPLVNGQSSAGIGFYIADTNNNTIPFYKFSSDGYTYGPDDLDKSVYQQNLLIIGPSQREGILVQFPNAGTYKIYNHRIIPTQVNGAFPNGYPDQTTHLAATITVTAGSKPFVDPLTLDFTKGVSTVIDKENIVRHTTVTFDIDIQQNYAPFAQFEVNNFLYDSNATDDLFDVKADKAERWTVSSSTLDVSHPFHIHVNPFEVDGVLADSVVGTLTNDDISLAETWVASNYRPPNMWRDTVFVPPKGRVDLVQQFGDGQVAFAGKTVFHCHYLEHEDQGMMKNLMIEDPNFCVAVPGGCSAGSDCCGYSDSKSRCRNGKCCTNKGFRCTKTSQCCKGGVSTRCDNGKCKACVAAGRSCSKNSECCSQKCKTATRKCTS